MNGGWTNLCNLICPWVLPTITLEGSLHVALIRLRSDKRFGVMKLQGCTKKQVLSSRRAGRDSLPSPIAIKGLTTRHSDRLRNHQQSLQQQGQGILELGLGLLVIIIRFRGCSQNGQSPKHESMTMTISSPNSASWLY